MLKWNARGGAWLVVFVLLILVPVLPENLIGKFTIELLTKALIMGIFALSLQLLIGYTGLVSLGHAAYFGLAAYLAAILASNDVVNGWLLLVATVGGAALLALLVGALVIRTQGIYFIMVTLAFAQMVYFVFHDTKIAGGSDGTYINTKPSFALAGWEWIDLSEPKQFYIFVVLALFFTILFLALILRSRFGHALIGIKHNQQRMTASGYNVYGYQLASFVLGGALAGLAGYLYALQYGYVNPEILSWHQSGNVMLMVILGGLASLPGAVLGALSFVLLSEWFSTLTKHWQLLMGIFIIVTVALLPHGLAGGWLTLRTKMLAKKATAHAASVRGNET